MLGSFLLAEVNIIQQTPDQSIVLYRSSRAEKVAAGFSLDASSFLESNIQFGAFFKRSHTYEHQYLFSVS